MIPDNDKYNKKAAGLLSTIYFNEKDRKEQKKALKNILTFYKSRATTDLMAGKAADIIKKISGKIDAPKKTDKNKIRAYKEDLKIINAQLADFICTSVAAAKKKRYRYIVADRTEYILRYSIKCEHTPTINDLIADMRSRDWKRKLTAIELLSKIGKAAKGAEATVIKYLGQKGFGTNGGNLRRFCAITLGNIGTTNPQGITRLIESFPDYNRGVSSHAKEAIKKIGIAALPYLIKGLKHKHHAVRYGSAEALGNLGSNAKKAVPALKEIAKNDKDPYVRKQAKGAVQMITNDF